MKSKIDLDHLDMWSAIYLAGHVRELTGKHCVDVRTNEILGDGYWRYILVSHDMNSKELNAAIDLAVSKFYS